MKYLVTGGTGFIGSALVKRLLNDGYDVRVLDNNLRGQAARLSGIMDRIEYIEADIRDAEEVNKACLGVDGVIHLAYLNGTEFFYSKPELVLDIAIKGMTNVIEGCMTTGVKELIFASSSEVYQTPPRVPTNEEVPLSIPDVSNPRYSYGGGKILGELMAINYGRNHFDRVVIFRPHNVYGPDMGYEHVIPQFVLRMKDLAKESKEKIDFPIQGSGKETRAFVYIDDFIDGLMLVIKKGEHLGIYHIGTMEEVSIEQVALETGKYFSRKIRIVPGPLQEGGTKRRCPDIAKMKSLGYDPKIKISEGLKVTVQWYDKNPKEANNKGV